MPKRWALLLISTALTALIVVSWSPAAADHGDYGRTLPAGWNLVTIPVHADSPAPADVFADVAAPLSIYRYSDGLHLTATDARFSSVSPGEAYWIFLAAETTVTVDGALTNVDSEFRLPITRGWNFVGSPWLSPIEWTDDRVSITNGAAENSLSDAIAAGWLTGQLYGHDPVADASEVILPNFDPAHSMEPWHGYLLFSEVNGELVLSPPPPDATPPTANIDSPSEDAELTGLIDVTGTIDDDQGVVQYQLQYAPAGINEFTTVETGSGPIIDGSLGTLDTTMLENGIGRIRLVVFDAAGNGTAHTRNVLVTGENKPGIFTLTFTDLEVPVSGIPVTVNRTYDSRRRGNSGDFGHGWNVEVVADGDYSNNRKPGDGWVIQSGGGFLNEPCSIPNETKSHVTEIRFSDTEFYRFTLQVHMSGFGSAISGGCDGSASFTQTGGVPGAELQIIGSNSVFWPNGTDQLQHGLFTDDIGLTYEPEAVRLTTISGRQYDLELTGGVTRIADANGNSVHISPGGVVHSSGKSVSFTRDGQGRITGITDPLGNSLAYNYDGAGDLSSVTDRVGSTISFDYNPDHYLLSVTDPLGNVPLRNIYDEDGRLVAQEDEDGNRTAYDIDLASNTTTVTDRLGTATNLAYDNSGLLSSASSDGASTSYTYDSRGNKLTETDPRGNTTTFTYDSNDNLTSEEDPLGNVTSYTYNSDGRPVTLTGAGGGAAKFAYDANGNLLSTTDADDNITAQYSYDSSGNVTQINTLGGTTDFEYNGSGDVTKVTLPSGLVKTFTYDANGRVLTEASMRTVDGSAVSETTSFTYDANGNVLTSTDPLGATTTYTYDAVGRILTKTDARGNVTAFEYDKRGNLVKKTFADGTFEAYGYDLENRKTAETDRAGRTTFFTYDSQNNLVETLFPDGSKTLAEFDDGGNMSNITDALGNVTAFAYDANGHRTSATDALGNVIAHVYNADGARISTTDPEGNITQFAYDAANFGAQRLTETIHPDGVSTGRTYADSGRIASVVDDLGNTTAYEYDGAGNLVKVTDPVGNETTYAYDEAGNRTSETDANGNTTTFEYDALGRLTERTLPLGQSETFTYDAVGNRVSRTDLNGDTTNYEYDSVNQLVKETKPDGSTVVYTYTDSGQIKTVTDSLGVRTYTYDVMDRVTEIDVPGSQAIEYAYDAAGNRQSMKFTVGTTSHTTSFVYDALNRLSTVTDPDGGVTVYTYGASGNRIRATYPNGTETHYTYDSRNRLTEMVHTESGGAPVLASYQYTLAPNGNRTQMIESDGAGVVRTVGYTYDALGRLMSETDDLSGAPATTTYAYDAAGNRTSMDEDGVVTGYTYDANDRLTSAGTTTFGYDANGNLTSRDDGGDITQYAYDSHNRLVEHTTPAGAVNTFAYDFQGNRVMRDADGDITKFVVDPLDNSDLPQVVAELDASDEIATSYVYGDDLISMKRGSSSHFYHTDGLGSTRLLTDPAGSISDSYAYDAFGDLATSSGATENDYLYAGEQLDPELGLYYLRARYMSPELGRFTSMDPFSGSAYDPRTLNKYTYASNNPVNMIDPTGQFSMGSVSISISISSTLSSMAVASIGYIGGKDLKDAYDKAKKLLDEIPGMKLNESATTAELFLSQDDDGNLEYLKIGGGAVDQAYSTVEALVSPSDIGGAGEVVANAMTYIWRFNSAMWMAQLPRVENDSGVELPGHYLSCGYNDYIFKTYSLELLNGVATKPFKPVLQVIGVYLAYINFLTFMAETVDDVAWSNVQAQPAGDSCGIPGFS